MSRYFMIQSWVGSHENEPDYNGQQAGERNARSIEAVPLYDQFGNANVSAFSDEAIAARSGVKKATKVPLKQRILPQAARVEKLHAEILELESAYKSGEFGPVEYTLLRDVAFKKLRRAQELLKRAVKPVEKVEVEEEISYASSYHPSDNNGHGESYSSPVGASFFAEAVDNLSSENMFKSLLKSACVVTRKVIHYKHKSAMYLQTLKEVRHEKANSRSYPQR